MRSEAQVLRRHLLALLLTAAVAAALLPPPVAAAQETDDGVLITALRTRGPSGASDEYVEIANRSGASVDISGWQLQGCATASGNPSTRATVPDGTVLPAGGYFLFANSSDQYSAGVTPDATYGTGIADGGAAGARIIDAEGGMVSGVGTTDPASQCAEGGGYAASFPTSAPYDVVRADDRTAATGDNAADFENVQTTPRNTAFDPDAEPDTGVDVDCTAPFAITAGYADRADKAITVTASDPDSRVTEVTVTSVDPDPAPGDVTVTEVSPSPAEGEDATARVRLSDDVPGLDDPAARYTVVITATAEDGDSSTCQVAVEVLPVRAIGEVTAPVPDGVDGRAHRSPFAPPSGNANGQSVAVHGVITQLTQQLSPTAANPNRVYYGFFLQSLQPAEGDAGPQYGDGDPRSSDGIFVFANTFRTLRNDDGSTPQYAPQVGDEVVLRGPVNEFFNATQLSSPFLVDVTRTGIDVETAIEVTEADPPDDFLDATVYWERLESMQVTVPAGAQVVSGRDVFTGSRDGEVWVIRGDHPVAQRENPYERRVFRDAHPLDNDGPTDLSQGPGDGNGYRILMASWGLKAAADDPRLLIAPARSYDTVTNAPTGGLYYTFGKYAVMVGEQPELERGVDPSQNHFPQVDYDRSAEWSAMIYNVENLYDFRDDPFSGCDLNTPSNPGCPTAESPSLSVTPPYDYAPSTQEEYDEQRAEIADQIAEVLNSPDIVTVQEAEKQDVCEPIFDTAVPASSRLECDLDPETAVEDRSGAPDVLEELAIEIFRRTDGEIRYAAAADAQHGRDVRGITSGFLYRADRVELVEDVEDDPVLGADPQIEYGEGLAPWVVEPSNPKAINATMPEGVELSDGGRFPSRRYALSRATQVALFRIWTDGIGEGDFVDRHVFSNHFSAGPNSRVEQRAEQANLNAAIARAILDDGGQVLVTGDLNVYPRPDDPFPSPETDPDRPPSDQLGALYEIGLTNLYDVILAEAPENAYSFIFQGQSQVLDQIFVDDATLDELEEVRVVHVNVDYPAEDPHGEPGRGASDHDPLFARFAFPVDDPDPDPDGVEVGPEDEGVAISIETPAGTVVVTFTGITGTGTLRVVAGDLPAGAVPPGVTSLGVGFELVADGFTFDEALVELPYSEDQLAEAELAPRQLRLLRLRDGGGLDDLRGDVDDDAGSVRGTVTSLGTFTLGAITGLERLFGGGRVETAVAISRSEFSPGAEVVYVATAFDFPDALTGGPVAAAEGAPILLVPNELPQVVADELDRLQPDRVVVLGGAAAVSDAVVAQLRAATEAEVTRAAGPDRYATAAAASARTFDPGVSDVYLATGFDFPDALTGGAAAARDGGPVLLVERRLPAVTRAELERLRPDRIWVLGGTAAVPDAVLAEVAAATGVVPQRLAGADRWGTAAAVAATFEPDDGTAFVATGFGFADALAGVPAAAQAGAPILLSERQRPAPGLVEALERLAPARVVLLGGTAALSAELEPPMEAVLRRAPQ